MTQDDEDEVPFVHARVYIGSSMYQFSQGKTLYFDRDDHRAAFAKLTARMSAVCHPERLRSLGTRWCRDCARQRREEERVLREQRYQQQMQLREQAERERQKHLPVMGYFYLGCYFVVKK